MPIVTAATGSRHAVAVTGAQIPLAPSQTAAIFGRMAKKSGRVVFKLSRVAEGDWQIAAHCPNGEIQYIKGFKAKEEIDEWMQGTRRIDWLRSQGYAK
jgi:hypothetical protein